MTAHDSEGQRRPWQPELSGNELGERQLTIGEAVAAAVVARMFSPYSVLLSGRTILGILDEVGVCITCGYPLDRVRNWNEDVRGVHKCPSYAQGLHRGDVA